jgi:hypothetical protein
VYQVHRILTDIGKRAAPAATFLVLFCVMTQAPAEQAPHVHGHGELNVAFEGEVLSMELRVPAHDVVGFEHAPSTDAERQAVESKLAELADAKRWFVPSEEAGCTLHGLSLTLGGMSRRSGDLDADHAAHGHAHEDQDSDGEGHSDLEGQYLFACSAPARLRSLKVHVLDALRADAELEANIVTEVHQARTAIESGDVGLRLR